MKLLKKMRVLARFGGFCAFCGLPNADTVDHIVPTSRGGADDEINLAPAHFKCNLEKGDSIIVPFSAMVRFRTPKKAKEIKFDPKPLILRWQYHKLRSKYAGANYWEPARQAEILATAKAKGIER